MTQHATGVVVLDDDRRRPAVFLDEFESAVRVEIVVEGHLLTLELPRMGDAGSLMPNSR